MSNRYAGKVEAPVNTDLETRITAALERRAEPAVPADFAARVVAALPPVLLARTRVSAGRWAGIAAAAVALAAMLVLAPHCVPSFTNLAFDAELLLTAELAAIASWLVLPGRAV